MSGLGRNDPGAQIPTYYSSERRVIEVPMTLFQKAQPQTQGLTTRVPQDSCQLAHVHSNNITADDQASE